MGATVTQIMSMMSREFVKLVLLAFVIASPLAWYAMNQWLEEFPYRASITWWIFGMAAMVAIVIALLTVGVQAIRAAIANPVKNLRTE